MVGCAPGVIHWDTGDDALRGALFLPGQVFTGSPPITNDLLLLTTADVQCTDLDFEHRDEPLRVASGVCRDGAQILVLNLVRHPDAAATGRYVSAANPDTLDEPVDWSQTLAETPRIAWGRHIGVEETSLDLDDGLGAPAIVIEAVTVHRNLDPLGEMVLREADDDTLAGTFSFPADRLSGRFRAERCPLESSWAFTLVEQVPVHLVPPIDCPIAF